MSSRWPLLLYSIVCVLGLVPLVGWRDMFVWVPPPAEAYVGGDSELGLGG